MKEYKNIKVFTDNIDQKVHAGAGCVIGFTAKINDKIIPNLVGVDIGCGMLCVELGNSGTQFN